MAFGEGPLSLPLLVEAAEELFIPVMIQNNVEGYEREVLERYKEPTWNYPVTRFVNGGGIDLLPRKDHIWKTDALTQRVANALLAAKRELPTWFDTLAEECSSGEVETAAFAMF